MKALAEMADVSGDGMVDYREFMEVRCPGHVAFTALVHMAAQVR